MKRKKEGEVLKKGSRTSGLGVRNRIWTWDWRLNVRGKKGEREEFRIRILRRTWISWILKGIKKKSKIENEVYLFFNQVS